MSKKSLSRRLRTLSSSSGSYNGGDGDLVSDLFGLQLSNQQDFENIIEIVDPRKRKRKARFEDFPDKVMNEIFKYLKQPDLKSLRQVSKTVNRVATEVFADIHTAIHVDSEDKITDFKHDMASTFNFPFTRFRVILGPIKRHYLITFAKQYVEYIKTLWIEPFERFNGEGDNGGQHAPCQHLLFKLTGILQQVTEVSELNIMFPSLSFFDYSNLEFENKFELEQLVTLAISFTKNGFCKFSSDLTLEILNQASELKKLYLRLPEPTDPTTESTELVRVLVAATAVPSIGLHLWVNTNHNPILQTIANIVLANMNDNIRGLTLTLGTGVHEFKRVVKLLLALEATLIKLKMFRRPGPMQGGQGGVIHLPQLRHLKFLVMESHRIPFAPIQVITQFPKLVDLHLHLRYGNEEFYKRSILHPLDKLCLHFHETPIMRVQIPECLLENLVSKFLKKLELINPPPGHLTFMSDWGQSIETLILAAPSAYGDDPTYPLHSVLGQLRGVVQLREDFHNDLSMLQDLKELHLLFPIDEFTADFLADLPKLYLLVVDDSQVSRNVIQRMRCQHHIYISWSPAESG